MPRRFAEIAFTPSVRAVQTRQGSRSAYRRLETDESPADTLGDREAKFIQERDGFYQATVSEIGWPYVQYRGGPAGFLKVLDPCTIGYADFRGNRQYLSVGNIEADGRVAMILMDYATRRRLKIWALARIVEATADPKLITRVSVQDYQAPVERAVVIAIYAFDWNCPQHITRRFTEAEIADLIAARS